MQKFKKEEDKKKEDEKLQARIKNDQIQKQMHAPKSNIMH
jgi:hypothetical protein